MFIENVGNLICPVGFDLGEDFKIVLSSVSEGDDKPVKYPKIFIKANLVLLNKMDMIDYSDFGLEFFQKKIKELNNLINILELSCKSEKDWKNGLTGLKSILRKNIIIKITDKTDFFVNSAILFILVPISLNFYGQLLI